MTPRVIASRSSATFLPEKSIRESPAAAAAGAVAVAATFRAPFCACCWRPRALPPAFAARLRAGVVRDDELLVELLDPEPLRELLVPPELRAADLRVLGLRAAGLRVLDLRALELPEPEPDARALDPGPRALDPPEAFRGDDGLDDELFREDDPPLLPPLDSAMLSSSEACARLPARCEPHYLMPTTQVTYA